MNIFHCYYNVNGLAHVIIVKTDSLHGPRSRDLMLFANIVLKNPDIECVVKDRHDLFNSYNGVPVLTLDDALEDLQRYRQHAEVFLQQLKGE